MRRIVVMAASEAGIHCAAEVKTTLPQAEVNILLPAGASDTARTAPVRQLQGPARPNDDFLAALDLSCIETSEGTLDFENSTFALTSSRGSLSIRFTEIVLEIPVQARLPRQLTSAANAFPLPVRGFRQPAKALEEALAGAASAPVLVVGSGMPALEAIFLALDSGAPQVLFAETPLTSAPPLEPHLQSCLLLRLADRVRHVVCAGPAATALSFTLAPDGGSLKAVQINGEAPVAVSMCLWADTLMARHPVLREEGFILDDKGCITGTEAQPAHVHLAGSGMALPPATLACGIQLPRYAGSAEVADLAAKVTAAAISEIEIGGQSCYGTRGARMEGFGVYRTGLTGKEAQAAGISAEQATLTLVLPPAETGCATGQARMNLTLVAHKESKTLIGASILGEGPCNAAVQALLSLALEGLSCATPLDILAVREHTGRAAGLFFACAKRLLDKIHGPIQGITPDEFNASVDAGADFFLLDVREAVDWHKGHLPEAHNIPVGQLKKRLSSECPRFVPFVIVCKTGDLAFETARRLSWLGAKDLYVLDGGMDLWPYPSILLNTNPAGGN
jgi:Rhodanese-related sulfurtransferase